MLEHCTMLALALSSPPQQAHLCATHHDTCAYNKKNDPRMRVVLVGLPGFEFCLQNRADTLQKKAQTERSSNKPLSYRLNQHKVRTREHNAKTTLRGGIMFAWELLAGLWCYWLRCLHQQTNNITAVADATSCKQHNNKKKRPSNESRFCWATRIRTKNDRTRICSGTITP